VILRLRWTDHCNAGVAFEMPLAREQLSQWIRARSAAARANGCEIDRLESKVRANFADREIRDAARTYSYISWLRRLRCFRCYSTL
jgi:hypothetical protein